MRVPLDRIDDLRAANRWETICSIVGWLFAATFALMAGFYFAGMDYAKHIMVIPSLVLFAAWVGATIRERVLRDRAHVPSPSDGCCDCGVAECDVIVAPDDRGRGEGYCWGCIDTWPADAPATVDELGIYVFPGRERAEGVQP
jgi:hypothetical protein